MIDRSEKKKLKIAMIVDQFPCVSETFILNQVIGLVQLGHDVDVIAFNKAKDDCVSHQKITDYKLSSRVNYFRKIPQGGLARFIQLAKMICLYIWRYPQEILKCLDFNKYGRHQAVNNLLLSEPFLKNRYDIVHCQFGPYGKQLSFLRDMLRNKIVTSFRGYDISESVAEPNLDIYAELFCKGERCFPVSQFFANRLQKLGCPRDKIRIVYSGINLEEFPFQQRDFNFKKNLRLLTIGRLVEKKGIRYAIAAVGRLVTEFPHLHYTIIGSGDQESELQQLVHTLHLENYVQFISFLPDRDLKKHYYNADIFVLPCVTAENQDQEGIPNVLKEAMAAGLPVISTKHSGIPELVEDGVSGLLAPEKDVQVLAEKLKYLITQPQLCITMTKNAREVVEQKFDVQKLNNHLESLYLEVLNN